MAIDTRFHPNWSQLWRTQTSWLRLFGVLLIACQVMACTIGDDDDDDETSISSSTIIRLDVALPSGTTPAQIGDLLLEVWLNDPDDSLLGNAAKDSDQIDTALLLRARTAVREVVPGGNVEERLIFDLDFVNSISAGNNLVFSILLFPDSQSTLPTFVARAGTIDLPNDLGSTVMMALDAAEIVQFDNTTVGEAAGTAVFTGTLAPSSPRAVVLNIATQDGMNAQAVPAVADEDYEETTGALIFGSGETAQNINIPIINDAVPEATEIFNVLIQLDLQFPNNNRAFIDGGLNGGTFFQVTGTITDND